MNDLVSEYQQYQDATAEGNEEARHSMDEDETCLLSFVEEGTLFSLPYVRS